MSRSDTARSFSVDDILRYATAIGALLVLLLPAARGSHEVLGWLPMWLLAMPLSAWLALRLANRSPVAADRARSARRRRVPGRQAYRRPRTATNPAPARAPATRAA